MPECRSAGAPAPLREVIRAACPQGTRFRDRADSRASPSSARRPIPSDGVPSQIKNSHPLEDAAFSRRTRFVENQDDLHSDGSWPTVPVRNPGPADRLESTYSVEKLSCFSAVVDSDLTAKVPVFTPADVLELL